MKVQKFGILMIALALVVAAGTSSANAAVVYSNGGSSITLAELLAGGSIEVDSPLGTVEFKNWDEFSAISGGNATDADPADIVVFGVENGSEVGVRYQTNGPVFQAILDATQDTTWSYDVDVNGGSIQTMHIELNGFSADDGGAIAIAENAKTDTEDVGDVFVYDNDFDTNSRDWDMFPGQGETWFEIHKDVALSSGDGGTAFFSELKQTYSVVPEPATFGLLGLGALGLIRRRRTA